MRIIAAAVAGAAVALVAPAQAAVRIVQIATAASPTHVAAAPGDDSRLFIVERSGRIRVYRDGVLQATPFLDISGPSLFAGGEGGLLSVAFAPDYAVSGLLYTFSTPASPQRVQVDEWRRSAASADTVDPLTRRTVLQIGHPTGNHVGGQLQFGPDSMLYVSLGDAVDAENAENLGRFFGKVLRIDPHQDGANPYRTPTGNPFIGTIGALPEVYFYGLRNPWRFSFDRVTGDIAVADVGQNQFEEVDFLLRGTGAGAFFGWDAFEANLIREPALVGPHVPPVLVRAHTSGDCSITGGYVVRDPALPSLFGRYIYSDFCAGAIRSAVLRTSGAEGDATTGLELVQPVSFGQDLGGCLYVVSLTGPVYRIAEADIAPSPCPRDLSPPETAITSAPPSASASTSASFAFVSSEPFSTFECRLDGAVAPCSSQFALTEGSHTFTVAARDAAANLDPTPASHTWLVDLSGPDTAITAAPASVAGATALFAFTSNEVGVSYRCRLDGGDAGACVSPVEYRGLGEGLHAFTVEAIDGAGNVDTTPAAHAWTVDVTPPTTRVVPPGTVVRARSVHVSFDSADAALFECSLDGAPMSACVSPLRAAGLAEGTHVLEVRATDAAGNVEQPAAAVRWVVDLSAMRLAVARDLARRLAKALSRGLRPLSLEVAGPPGVIRATLRAGGRVRAAGTVRPPGRLHLVPSRSSRAAPRRATLHVTFAAPGGRTVGVVVTVTLRR